MEGKLGIFFWWLCRERAGPDHLFIFTACPGLSFDMQNKSELHRAPASWPSLWWMEIAQGCGYALAGTKSFRAAEPAQNEKNSTLLQYFSSHTSFPRPWQALLHINSCLKQGAESFSTDGSDNIFRLFFWFLWWLGKLVVGCRGSSVTQPLILVLKTYPDILRELNSHENHTNVWQIPFAENPKYKSMITVGIDKNVSFVEKVQ